MLRFLKDDRFKFVLALGILFFAAFLTLAFCSYLFTWKIDQSKLDINSGALLSNPDIGVDNWAGKIGFMLANLFIHKWFGIASFAFIFLLVLTGFRLLKIRLLPLRKSIKYSIIAMIWLSVTLGYFEGIIYASLPDYGQAHFPFGGCHGFYLSNWLNGTIGKLGTFLLLIITLVAFVIFTVKNSLQWFYNLFRKKEKEPVDDTNGIVTDKEDTVITDENTFPLNMEENIKEENIVEKNTEEENKEVIFEDTEPEIKSAENTDKDKTSDNDDIELTVEKEKEKEEEVSDKITTKPMGDYDPTLDLSLFKLPDIDLLEDHRSENSEVSDEELMENKNKIVETLGNYKIKIDKIKATIGPTITLYEIVPAPGVRISKIKNLEDDIALSLSALGIRIIAPIPGKGTIGIEVPNQKPEIVSMRSIISSSKFQDNNYELPVGLGKTISNETYVVDLTKMPHVLVAGATGQGKSVGLNAIITSLLYKKHPSQLKFVLIDPKKVELTLFSRIERHYLARLPDLEEAIITDTQVVINTLNSLTIEMEQRYDLLKKAHVRNIKEYNSKFIKRSLNPEEGHKFLPYLVVVVDEFADLIMTAGKEVETPLARIAQLARAVGIHLVIATQRPSTNIITGVIKANFPVRIAYKVVSMVDSRTILDSPGANQLIGKGDMLISIGSNMIRLQCAFIDTPEIEKITDYISKQQAYPSAFELPEYVDESSGDLKDVDLKQRDALFEEAARLVVIHQQGSTSLIQRKFSIGYNRAGRIIDQLEAAGIVGPYEGSKARQVLFSDEYSLEQFLNSLDSE